MDSSNAAQHTAAAAVAHMSAGGAGDERPVGGANQGPSQQASPLMTPPQSGGTQAQTQAQAQGPGGATIPSAPSTTHLIVWISRWHILRLISLNLHPYLPGVAGPWPRWQRQTIVAELAQFICHEAFANPRFCGRYEDALVTLNKLFLDVFEGDGPPDFAVFDCLQMEEGLEPLLDEIFRLRPELAPSWWEARWLHFEQRRAIYESQRRPSERDAAGEHGRGEVEEGEGRREDINVDDHYDYPSSDTDPDDCPLCDESVLCRDCTGLCPGRLRPCCSRRTCSDCAEKLTGHECPECDPELDSDGSGMDID